MTDDELRDELLRRKAVDQEMRRSDSPDPAVDEDNTRWLEAVVEERGWPLVSQVGEEAAFAAWLLAQHADLHLGRRGSARKSRSRIRPANPEHHLKNQKISA
ncbi:hypothetical protein J5X84_43615 [Streptosporangiaceae bacterium NEAU-GS5]|nr:hypothetical protein [Streptosporangiaceae bacterium NEAU-GS5]